MLSNPSEVDQLEVWANIDKLKTLLISVKAGDSKTASTIVGLHSALDRLATCKSLEAWFFTTDFISRLAAMNMTISNLANLVTRLLDTEDDPEPTLTSISVETENLLNSMRQNGVLSGQYVEVKESLKTIRDFTNSVLEGLKLVESEKNKLVEQIESLKGLIVAQDSNLKNEVSVVKAAQAEFKLLIDSFEKSAKDSLKEIEGENTSALEAIKKAAEISELEIQGLLNASKRLSERVYWDKVSKSYAEYSLKQGGMALIYSGLTIAAGIFTVLQSRYLFENTQEISAGAFNIRFAGSVAAVALFAFLAAETAGYRHQARDAKRTQLDLSSVEPAIAYMDDDDSKSIRIQVVQQTFSRPRPTVERWVDRFIKRK